MAVSNHILKNLHSLIHNSTIKYLNEFVWQDIELTEEFKRLFEETLIESNYDVEFLGATAVITSPSKKYTFVPNQWFVIASYAVEVYEELHRYKKYLKMVAEARGIRFGDYVKELRDNATVTEKKLFLNCANSIFAEIYTDHGLIDEACSRLWRFSTDYSWWSGQKTIDRGDFYMSVILNMLNLVNVNQGYVADIVSIYATNSSLRQIITSIDGFTMNMENESISGEIIDIEPDRIVGGANDRATKDDSEVIPQPSRVRIKINGKSTLKEIKFNG